MTAAQKVLFDDAAAAMKEFHKKRDALSTAQAEFNAASTANEAAKTALLKAMAP